MYEKWIKYHRFAGKHIYYKRGEPDCPKYTIPHWHLKIGDYIIDSNGIVAQVLDIQISQMSSHQKVVQNTMKIYTCFGRDTVAYTNQNYKAIKIPDFKRDRLSFTSTCSRVLQRLTANDKLFLWNCVTNDNIVDAYVRSGGRYSPTAKASAKNRLNRILECKESEGVLRSMLQDLIKEKGLDKVDFYLNKLEESIQGPIKTSVQLEILKTIAKASGSDEVIQLMAPEDGGAPPPMLNPGEPDEAPFEEIQPPQLGEAVNA